MSKNKDILEQIKDRVFTKKKDEMVEKANQTIENEVKEKELDLDKSLYDVYLDEKRVPHILKINYNLQTGKAELEGVFKFDNKTVAAIVQKGKKGLHTMYMRQKRIFERKQGE